MAPMRVLMCPPMYYGIQYEINRWMKRSRQSDHLLAHRQWRDLYLLLKDRLGVDVSLIVPKPGLPDMVFTANAGFVWDKNLLLSNFRHEVRRGEAAHFANWFAANGYTVFHLPLNSYFEGEGDLLMCGGVLFAGHPIRSSVASHANAADILQRQILSLRLIDPWFYHLDTCFCPLGRTAALYYPAAFDHDGLNLLRDHVHSLLAVSEEEARRFACNAVVVDNTIIMNDGCPNIRRDLEARGFSVFELSLSEFIKAGGSAKCLVLKIPHDDCRN
jgi:N-dimethylarginine dimethylaminohydrolase